MTSEVAEFLFDELTSEKVAISCTYREWVRYLEGRFFLLVNGEGQQVVSGGQIYCMPVSVVEPVT